MFGSTKPKRPDVRGTRRSTLPVVEALEDRKLLYAAMGAQWVYGSRITYSFVPDGTNVGGPTSNLYATLNTVAPTAAWKQQIQQAAALWSSYAHINLALVSDNGAPMSGPGNQQGDPNFGDIRIAMIPQQGSILAITQSPPPLNGGSNAGDIIFNSNQAWQVNNNVDLESVALHEFGHALGLDHSALQTAVMYAYYQGLTQSPTTDDISGIQSVYGAYPADLDTNRSLSTATNITSRINSNNQIYLSSLNLSGTGDADFFYVTVPSTVANGQFSVWMQTANLSSASPLLTAYDGSGHAFAQNGSANVYGGWASMTLSGVSPGQGFYFRASPASGIGSYGAYGLIFNFGTAQASAIAPPNTVVAAQTSTHPSSTGLSIDGGGSQAGSGGASSAPSARGNSGFSSFSGRQDDAPVSDPTAAQDDMTAAVEQMNDAAQRLPRALGHAMHLIRSSASSLMEGLSSRNATSSIEYAYLSQIDAAVTTGDPVLTRQAVDQFMTTVVHVGNQHAYGDALTMGDLRGEPTPRHAPAPATRTEAGPSKVAPPSRETHATPFAVQHAPNAVFIAPWTGTTALAHDAAMDALVGAGRRPSRVRGSHHPRHRHLGY